MADKKLKMRINEFQGSGIAARPVEKTDRWCVRDKKKMPDSASSPYGFVYSAPVSQKKLMLDNIKGHIVRTKIKNGIFLMQVVKQTDNIEDYALLQGRHALKFRKRDKKVKIRHFMNLRNLNKCALKERREIEKGITYNGTLEFLAKGY